MSSTNDHRTFGRNEMAALLSIDAAMMPTASSGYLKQSSNKTAAVKKGEDISALNASETAALLALQQAGQERLGVKKRLRVGVEGEGIEFVGCVTSKRTKKHMEYHKLIEEQDLIASLLHGNETSSSTQKYKQQEEEGEENDRKSRTKVSHASSDSDDDLMARRARKEPEIVRKRHEGSIILKSAPKEKLFQRRQRRSSSSSDNASSSSDDSSSSEDDEEIDARRRRIRERAAVEDVPSHRPQLDVRVNSIDASVDQKIPQGVEKDEMVKRRHSSDSKSSPSSSSDSSSTSGSNSSSHSDDEVRPAVIESGNVAKPTFVPRHKRDTVAEQLKKRLAEDEQEKQRQILVEKRKLQSRVMVAQAVAKAENEAATAVALAGENIEEEDLVSGMGKFPPDDTDECATKEEEIELHDAWEVREILRYVKHLEKCHHRCAEFEIL